MTRHLTCSRIESRAGWNVALAELGRAQFPQSWEWGEVKSKYGWSAVRFVWKSNGATVAAAQVLTRTVRAGARFRLQYAPRGPLLDWKDQALLERVLRDLAEVARQAGAISIKIDPAFPVEEHGIVDLLERRGWVYSPDQIQFKNTVLLDLTPSEDDLLAAMKQKTRYNVRLAGRRGVEVRPGGLDDFDLLYDLYAQTSVRDGFVIRSPGYYREVWSTMLSADMARVLIAEVAGAAVAALIVVQYGDTATFLYGMSSDEHRDKMPNYLLQWEAIRWARERGCHTYDLWGAPDELVESDPLWGVYRFKSGFGGELLRTIGAYDYPNNRPLYLAYTKLLPALLRFMRRRGHAQTRALLE